MDILFENLFFVIVLLVCVGMHFFMHGRHGHGHGGRDHAAGAADGRGGTGDGAGASDADPH